MLPHDFEPLLEILQVRYAVVIRRDADDYEVRRDDQCAAGCDKLLCAHLFCLQKQAYYGKCTGEVDAGVVEVKAFA